MSYFLILEITEPVANFLLLDENHKIDEAARHSTPDVNSFRTILPGHVYVAPPAFEGIEINQVSVKATTWEKMGFVGRGEAMACECVCLVSND